MKIFLSFLLILISFLSYSQTWSPPGANWKYSFYDGFGSEGYLEIQYIGDTLINSQPVKILTKTLNSYNHLTAQYFVYTLAHEYTYENNGIVYLWFNNNWDTLYNFNASIGESWRMAKQPYVSICDSNSTLTVIDTGTIIINNVSLKYLILNFNYGGMTPLIYSDTIIEKIGFIHSYMFPYELCNSALDGVEGGPFRCYSDNNFPLYQPYFPYNCDFIVGVEENEFRTSLSVYPNPVHSTIKIEGLPKNNFYPYSIFSIDGKLWKTGKVSEEINVDELTDGIYFLRIFHITGSKNFKFVKH